MQTTLPAALPPAALGLVLVAAILHAAWNYLLHGAQNRQVFTWWAILVGSVLYSPFLFFGPPVPVEIWRFAVLSGLAEVVYFLALNRAYAQGEFSLIYPMARGLNPALLAIWAAVWLGDVPSAAGIGGLLVILFGLGLAGGLWGPGARRGVWSWHVFAAAASVALSSSVCSAIDAAAVRQAPATQYTVLVLGLTTLFMLPVMLGVHGVSQVRAVARGKGKSILLVGLILLLGYLLVLQAFSMAKVGYIGAIREVSVVFGALAGWLGRGEGFGPERVAGAIVIFAGILVLTIAG